MAYNMEETFSALKYERKETPSITLGNKTSLLNKAFKETYPQVKASSRFRIVIDESTNKVALMLTEQGGIGLSQNGNSGYNFWLTANRLLNTAKFLNTEKILSKRSFPLLYNDKEGVFELITDPTEIKVEPIIERNPVQKSIDKHIENALKNFGV